MAEAVTAEEQWAANFFSWASDTYVVPEVVRRQEAGELRKPALLYRAQVIFDLDKLPEVRLNDEVKGRIEAVAARPLAAGDDVMLDDIASIERFELDDDDPNAAHVTLLLGPKSRWHIVFNWQYNAGLIAEHLSAAREFFEQAQAALDNDRLRAFPEAAFAAAELLARAELLSLPDRGFRDSKTHKTVKARFNQWVKTQGLDPRFPQLLNDLADMRAPARYVSRDFELDRRRASNMLATLADMRECVEEHAPSREFDRVPSSRPIKAVAAEPITAGHPVTMDYSGRSWERKTA